LHVVGQPVEAKIDCNKSVLRLHVFDTGDVDCIEFTVTDAFPCCIILLVSGSTIVNITQLGIHPTLLALTVIANVSVFCDETSAQTTVFWIVLMEPVDACVHTTVSEFCNMSVSVALYVVIEFGLFMVIM
jgi:hypothetical protein